MQPFSTELLLGLLCVAVLFSLAAAAFAARAYAALRSRQSGEDAERLSASLAEAKRELQDAMARSEQKYAQAMSGLINFVSASESRSGEKADAASRLAQQQLAQMASRLDEGMRTLQGMADERFARMLQQSAAAEKSLTAAMAERVKDLRSEVSAQLADVRRENTEKLERIRETVDQKIDKTLSERLRTSFQMVDDKLGLVQSGLGEMRRMAESVAKLQGVLANVKTRGNFGERQLSAILAEMLTPAQYSEQVRVVPTSNAAVDFAVRLPGRGKDEPCWLPIDAKFPLEDWEALQAAQADADQEGAQRARKKLEAAVLKQARSIREKYVCPPWTTDFAVMFLPSESLYAEVLSIPGLFDRMQREWRITPAGPTVISALLNSLLLGFMTLAIEKRSGDVWRILNEVRTEFENFSRQFALVEKKFREAQSSLEGMTTRTRAMEKRMQSIESLGEEAERLSGFNPERLAAPAPAAASVDLAESMPTAPAGRYGSEEAAAPAPRQDA